MTCRFPNDCRKSQEVDRKTPRNTICRGCALSVALKRPEAVAALQERYREHLARKFAWLPTERRQEYENLKARKFKAEEAKAIILQDLARG